MRVIITGTTCNHVYSKEIEGSLSQLQALVGGGYLEMDWTSSKDSVVCYVNEEGFYRAFPPNANLPHILGPAIFVNTNGRGDHIDFSDQLLEETIARIRQSV